MEYVIIGLLALILIILIIILVKTFKKKDHKDNLDMLERLSRFEVNVTKEIGDFKSDLSKEIISDFTKMDNAIEMRMDNINKKVHERIDQNFEKTNKTFTSVLERLSKIDEAQKKIDTLSSDIVSLQGVLTDKKTRGIYGEVNLEHIMSNIFGTNNDKIYKMQYSFDNNTTVDCALFAPEPLGTIGIDSKFPLENYERMTNKKLTAAERETAFKLFKTDVKKHIDAIAEKYIIDGVTSDEAIMFLPAEAIFAEINAYHADLLSYAYTKKVWICGPTTLMSTLSTISMILKNIERDKYTKVIHEELNKLGIEFKRYKERWDKLSKSIDSVSTEIKDIHTTTDKITKKFDQISSVDLTLLENTKRD